MSPPTHLLRVEGVNLSAFVFDTRDLSTNRGGSLMLLNAVKIAQMSAGSGAKELSVGASSGLFEITTDDPVVVVGKVREALAKDCPDATFVVDVTPITDLFRTTVESLIAANRWRQMQAASLAIPPGNNSPNWSQPTCDLDGLRPSGNKTLQEKWIGDTTFRRREHGREKNKNFTKTKPTSANSPNSRMIFRRFPKATSSSAVSSPFFTRMAMASAASKRSTVTPRISRLLGTSSSAILDRRF